MSSIETNTYTGILENAPAPPPGSDAAAGNAASMLGDSVNALTASESVFSWGGYFQALALLCLIIALLWAALWFLKKRGGFPRLGIMGGDLSLESRLNLGPKKSLVVVRFLNKRLLLGVSDQQISLLTELTADEEHSDTSSSEENQRRK